MLCRKSKGLFLLLILSLSVASHGVRADVAPANVQTNTPAKLPRWETEIRAFEAMDKTNPPPQGAVLFVGSSAIRIWKTMAQDFPGVPVINRGFGGSQIPDVIAYANRIVIPYHPRLIVFYAGDNDLAAGKSAQQVVTNFQTFVRIVHAQLPKTKIDFISIKPSPARWKGKAKIDAVNAQVAAMQNDELGYIDIYSHMLGSDGNPVKELFQRDGVHPNRKGYEIWATVIRPYLN